MNSKIENALKRLNIILPLKQNQDKCTPEVKVLHQQMLQSFITRGRILTKEEMAPWARDISAALNVLSKLDMVIVTENGEPIGAYPFTKVEREHKILVNSHDIYAMCALDALAIAPMFEETVQITSQCRVTGDPVNIQMSGAEIKNLAAVRDIRFGVSWDAADDSLCCAESLCMEMIFLRDKKTAQEWFSNGSVNREIFTLQEAVQFSSRFFSPLLL